ncbi:MAG: HAD family phosphatase, partial [Candidatus Omnitrophica bacterium]|nr:HAD family phosphatase [Candidatus Omnitrophota bacterium]
MVVAKEGIVRYVFREALEGRPSGVGGKEKWAVDQDRENAYLWSQLFDSPASPLGGAKNARPAFRHKPARGSVPGVFAFLRNQTETLTREQIASGLERKPRTIAADLRELERLGLLKPRESSASGYQLIDLRDDYDEKNIIQRILNEDYPEADIRKGNRQRAIARIQGKLRQRPDFKIISLVPDQEHGPVYKSKLTGTDVIKIVSPSAERDVGLPVSQTRLTKNWKWEWYGFDVDVTEPVLYAVELKFKRRRGVFVETDRGFALVLRGPEKGIWYYNGPNRKTYIGSLPPTANSMISRNRLRRLWMKGALLEIFISLRLRYRIREFNLCCLDTRKTKGVIFYPMDKPESQESITDLSIAAAKKLQGEPTVDFAGYDKEGRLGLLAESGEHDTDEMVGKLFYSYLRCLEYGRQKKGTEALEVCDTLMIYFDGLRPSPQMEPLVPRDELAFIVIDRFIEKVRSANLATLPKTITFFDRQIGKAGRARLIDRRPILEKLIPIRKGFFEPRSVKGFIDALKKLGLLYPWEDRQAGPLVCILLPILAMLGYAIVAMLAPIVLMVAKPLSVMAAFLILGLVMFAVPMPGNISSTLRTLVSGEDADFIREAIIDALRSLASEKSSEERKKTAKEWKSSSMPLSTSNDWERRINKSKCVIASQICKVLFRDVLDEILKVSKDEPVSLSFILTCAADKLSHAVRQKEAAQAAGAQPEVVSASSGRDVIAWLEMVLADFLERAEIEILESGQKELYQLLKRARNSQKEERALIVNKVMLFLLNLEVGKLISQHPGIEEKEPTQAKLLAHLQEAAAMDKKQRGKKKTGEIMSFLIGNGLARNRGEAHDIAVNLLAKIEELTAKASALIERACADIEKETKACGLGIYGKRKITYEDDLKTRDIIEEAKEEERLVKYQGLPAEIKGRIEGDVELVDLLNREDIYIITSGWVIFEKRSPFIWYAHANKFVVSFVYRKKIYLPLGLIIFLINIGDTDLLKSIIRFEQKNLTEKFEDVQKAAQLAKHISDLWSEAEGFGSSERSERARQTVRACEEDKCIMCLRNPDMPNEGVYLLDFTESDDSTVRSYALYTNSEEFLALVTIEFGPGTLSIIDAELYTQEYGFLFAFSQGLIKEAHRLYPDRLHIRVTQSQRKGPIAIIAKRIREVEAVNMAYHHRFRMVTASLERIQNGDCQEGLRALWEWDCSPEYIGERRNHPAAIIVGHLNDEQIYPRYAVQIILYFLSDQVIQLAIDYLISSLLKSQGSIRVNSRSLLTGLARTARMHSPEKFEVFATEVRAQLDRIRGNGVSGGMNQRRLCTLLEEISDGQTSGRRFEQGRAVEKSRPRRSPNSRPLELIYISLGLISGCLVAVIMLIQHCSNLPEALLLGFVFSAAASILGWLSHELGHLTARILDFGHLHQKRAGPIASAVLLGVTTFVFILLSLYQAPSQPFLNAFFSAALCNYAAHTLADDGSLFYRRGKDFRESLTSAIACAHTSRRLSFRLTTLSIFALLLVGMHRAFSQGSMPVQGLYLTSTFTINTVILLAVGLLFLLLLKFARRIAIMLLKAAANIMQEQQGNGAHLLELGRIPPAAESQIKCVIVDWGNVISHFDYNEAAKRLADKFDVSSQEVHRFFEERNGNPHNPVYEFERGKIDFVKFSAELNSWLCSIRSLPQAVTLTRAELEEMLISIWIGQITETLDLIRILKEKGYRIYVLTNTSDIHYNYLVTQVLPLLALREEHLFASCHTGIAKPDALSFRLVAARAGVDVNQCLLVDDTQQNIEAAREVGLLAVQFNPQDAAASIAEIVDILADTEKVLRIVVRQQVIRGEYPKAIETFKGYLEKNPQAREILSNAGLENVFEDGSLDDTEKIDLLAAYMCLCPSPSKTPPGLEDGQTLKIPADQYTLLHSKLFRGRKTAPLVVMQPAWRKNIGALQTAIRYFQGLGFNVLAVDHRHHGESQGRFCGVQHIGGSDLNKAARFVLNNKIRLKINPPDDVIAFGPSL